MYYSFLITLQQARSLHQHPGPRLLHFLQANGRSSRFLRTNCCPVQGPTILHMALRCRHHSLQQQDLHPLRHSVRTRQEPRRLHPLRRLRIRRTRRALVFLQHPRLRPNRHFRSRRILDQVQLPKQRHQVPPQERRLLAIPNDNHHRARLRSNGLIQRLRLPERRQWRQPEWMYHLGRDMVHQRNLCDVHCCILRQRLHAQVLQG